MVIRQKPIINLSKNKKYYLRSKQAMYLFSNNIEFTLAQVYIIIIK